MRSFRTMPLVLRLRRLSYGGSKPVCPGRIDGEYVITATLRPEQAENLLYSSGAASKTVDVSLGVGDVAFAQARV